MPAASFWIFACALLCAALHAVFALSASFSDWFNGTVAAFFRSALSCLTVWLPFSLAETLIYCLPAAFVILLVLCIRAARQGLLPALRIVFGVLSVGALVYVLFVLTFAGGYRGAPLSEKMGTSVTALSVDDLTEAASVLAERAAESLDEISFRADGASVMPYSYAELSEKLMVAYTRVHEKYPFIQHFPSRIKPLSLSKRFL